MCTYYNNKKTKTITYLEKKYEKISREEEYKGSTVNLQKILFDTK